MRLIDADAIEYTDLNKDIKVKGDKKIEPFYIAFKERIDKMTTISAVEQKHGHWIIRTIFSEGAKEIVCSNCGENGFWREKPSYCPFCGAKMDEVSEDDR